MSVDPDAIETLADAVRRSTSALFITGAGLSADSGLPTYRGVGGLYERAATDEGIPIEVALSGPMMRTEPETCWKYIHQIEATCRGAKPNRGHEVIAQLQAQVDRSCVLTQNVDGFHRDVGTENLIEIHGNIHELHCIACDHERLVDSYEGLDSEPSCPQCGALIRPRVVLFGELLPPKAIERLTAELATGFDLVVSIGTTSAFPYIAEPVVAAPATTMTVEINPGETAVSALVDLRIRARARETFEALHEALVRAQTNMAGD